jgi:hypothetical protein
MSDIVRDRLLSKHIEDVHMRKFIAAIMVAGAALLAGPATAADFPEYPPIIEIPDVNYGVQGSFYLRGSVAGNALWAHQQRFFCTGCGGGTFVTEGASAWGFGYSFGAGVGYETGYGPRFDLTIDHLRNEGLANSRGQKLNLRSTFVLANGYYDFGFSDYGSAGGGFGAYVGAGLGGGYNWLESRGPFTGYDPDGGSFTPVGALMTGVTYDMGTLVADLGYRMLYVPQLTNGDAAMGVTQGPYYVDNNFIHEVRGTLRYRFN